MIASKVKMDYEVFLQKISSANQKLRSSRNIKESHRRIIGYIFNTLMDGINKERFLKYCYNNCTTYLSIKIHVNRIMIIIYYRSGEQLKSFAELDDVEKVINDIEVFMKEIGLKCNKIGNKYGIEKVDFYFSN